jgi:hypothetical protein
VIGKPAAWQFARSHELNAVALQASHEWTQASGDVVIYERKNEHNGKVVQLISEEWARLIRFCQELGHGEIEKLKIQDGVPVIADVVREKVKFT